MRWRSVHLPLGDVKVPVASLPALLRTRHTVRGAGFRDHASRARRGLTPLAGAGRPPHAWSPEPVADRFTRAQNR